MRRKMPPRPRTRFPPSRPSPRTLRGGSAMSSTLTEPEAAPAVAAPTAAARLLVSLATYNERDNLPRLIDEIHAVTPAADVLVIDDNSPDGTGKVADARAAADPRVKVLHRAGKLGLGTAIMA